ncbi:putative nuclease HARBI1 [Leptidea sinapis]|uniref:putative nuclease HARBI1 n=1 Tax=Leptidea sinapis TaxID=189913 RepID=UPI0021C32979|nr:putative nuclease HARBI1 [Leptidea sinapis]
MPNPTERPAVAAGFYNLASFPRIIGALDCTHIRISSPGGSVHDTTIWNDSPLAAEFEAGRFGSYCLLGDSGYPCLRYLLTPYLNPSTPSQEAYNRAHITTRNTVERCFGVLERSFPCLQIGMQLMTEKVLIVIVACVVIHNMSLELDDYIIENNQITEAEVEDNVQIQVPHGQNFSIRNTISENYFQ